MGHRKTVRFMLMKAKGKGKVKDQKGGVVVQQPKVQIGIGAGFRSGSGHETGDLRQINKFKGTKRDRKEQKQGKGRRQSTSSFILHPLTIPKRAIPTSPTSPSPS